MPPTALSVTILARMHREYFKHYSHELGRDMESLVFGHAGQPILVFPTSMGRFFEYEDAGMIPLSPANSTRVQSRFSASMESTVKAGTTRASIRRAHLAPCSVRAVHRPGVSAFLAMEEPCAPDRRHRMQLRRISRAQFLHASSRHRFRLRHHERLLRHQELPRWLL